MAFDVLPGLGQPLRRLEDPRLLTGGGRYAADAAAPGALQAVFLRSPHAMPAYSASTPPPRAPCPA